MTPPIIYSWFCLVDDHRHLYPIIPIPNPFTHLLLHPLQTCYAFVDFDNENDAEAALKDLNKKSVNGQEVKIGK